MSKSSLSNRSPFFLSAALHALLFAFLLVEIPHSAYRLPSAGDNKPIVRAALIQQSSKPIQNIQPDRHKTMVNDQNLQQLEPQELKLRAKEAKIEEAQKQLAVLARDQKIQQQQRLVQKAQMLQAKKIAEKKRQQAVAQAKAKAKALAEAKQKQQEKKQLERRKRTQVLMQKQKELQQKMMQQEMSNEQSQLSQIHSEIQAQQAQGVIDQYKAQIIQAIEQQWMIPNDVDKNLSCRFLVRMAPSGTVISVSLLKSSGNSALDHSAEVAIYKASPLPVPKDPALFDNFRELRLTVSPKKILNGDDS